MQKTRKCVIGLWSSGVCRARSPLDSSPQDSLGSGAQDKIQLLDKGFDSDTFPKMNARTGFVKSDTDESGLDKAYSNSSNLFLDKDGTLYVSGTKGGFAGSE